MKEKLTKLISSFLAVQIFRQIITASICKVFDVGLFYVFDSMSGRFETVWVQVLFATVLARIPSAVLNYFLNRKFVFASDADVASSMSKFMGVAAVQLFLQGKIGFLDIVRLTARETERAAVIREPSIEEIISIHRETERRVLEDYA